MDWEIRGRATVILRYSEESCASVVADSFGERANTSRLDSSVVYTPSE